MTPSQTAHPTEGEIAQTPVERTEPGPFSQLVDREWLDLCEKSDRTSDHPDMCLITRVELAGAMSEAFFAGTDAARSTQPSRPQGEEGLWRPISVEALDGQCVEMRMLSTWKARWTLDEEGHGFFDRIGDAPRAQTEWRPMPHASDCAVHNMPAMPNGPCDCGAEPPALSNQGKPSS